MAGPNPIRIEFVVANGQQFLQGWEKLIDGLADRFESGMGGAVDRVVEAIKRIETAMTGLNKVNLFDFGDAFKETNANLTQVIDAITKGNALLEKMKTSLHGVAG